MKNETLKCESCNGRGYNAETKQIYDDFYAHKTDWSRRWCDKITQDEVQALVDDGRLKHFTHTWNQDDGWKRREDDYIPTAKEVNEFQDEEEALAPFFHKHDLINRRVLVETRAKRLGVFGYCLVCNGIGTAPFVPII